MIQSGSKMTVVAFIIMPCENRSYTVEALQGQASMKQLRDTVSEIQQSIGKRIFEAASASKIPSGDNLLSEKDVVTLKRRIFAIKKSNLPAIVTHNMVDDNNKILQGLRNVKLFNHESDRVKVVFHPGIVFLMM